METPAAPAHAFTHTFAVEASNIDQLGHANNVAYLRWVQDVAAGAEPPAQVWVVQEHRIRYHRSAYAGEQLTARTWVADVRGASSKRLTRIERHGELLCTAETEWVLLTAATGRPARVPQDVSGRLLAGAASLPD